MHRDRNWLLRTLFWLLRRIDFRDKISSGETHSRRTLSRFPPRGLTLKKMHSKNWKSLWNWLLATVFLTLFITLLPTPFLSLMGSFSLRNPQKMDKNPSHIFLLTNEEPMMLSTCKKDLLESHLLSQVKVKRNPSSYNVRLFSLKNGGGPLTAYAAKKDEKTWWGEVLSVDFLKTQNDSGTPESTIEGSLFEAHLIDISWRPGNIDSSVSSAFQLDFLLENNLLVSAGDSNGATHRADSLVTFVFLGDSTAYGDSAILEFETKSSIVVVPDQQAQPTPRDQKRKKPAWIIHSERKAIKRRCVFLKASDWLGRGLPDTSYYRRFKKRTSVLLPNGAPDPLPGYGADKDGPTHGVDVWDYFDTEIGSDFDFSQISEFEIGIRSMDPIKLKAERKGYVSLIADGEEILRFSEKLSAYLERGLSKRCENGKVKLVGLAGDKIEVHPNSSSWEIEFGIQKQTKASMAFFDSKRKRIDHELSIRHKQQLQLLPLEQAEKEAPRTRKTRAAMRRYKKPAVKQFPPSYQKLRVEGQEPYPWRRLEDVSHYPPYPFCQKDKEQGCQKHDCTGLSVYKYPPGGFDAPQQ